jgi:hypothetical protein
MIKMKMAEQYCVYGLYTGSYLIQPQKGAGPAVQKKLLFGLHQDRRLGAAGLGYAHPGSQQCDLQAHAPLLRGQW